MQCLPLSRHDNPLRALNLYPLVVVRSEDVGGVWSVAVLPHPNNCWGESLGDSSRDGVQSCTVLYSPQCTALHPCPYRHTPTSHPHKPHKPPVIIAPSCSACEAEGGCLSSSSINNCYSRGHSRYRLLYSWLLDSQCDSQ